MISVRRGAAVAWIAAVLLRVAAAYTVTLFPINRNGAVVAVYNVYIIRNTSVSYAELNSTIKSMVVQFPLEYSLGSGPYTCKFEGAASPCQVIGTNLISI